LLHIGGWLKALRRQRAEGLASGGRRTRGAVVLRLPRLRWRISNLVDRYIVRRYFTVFLMVLASGLILYVVADLGENADDILKNKVPRGVVFDYYKYLSLQIIYDITPIVVLVTTLLTFSVLSRDSELTAFKSVGISLFRLSLPAIAVTAAIVAGNVYLQSEILPVSNQQVARLKNQIRGKEVARTYRRADRQWLFGQGRYIYNYLRYDPAHQALERLQVFEFEDDGRLSRRLYAERAEFDGSGWVFRNSWTRTFHPDGSVDFDLLPGSRRSDYSETPEYFTSEIRPPGQMRYLELRRYIQEIESRGEAVPDLRVELQRKVSYPAISLVMVLVALPFAFRLGRQGALYGIGLSVVIGMIFMAVFIFFSTLGSAAVLPPLVAVWAPNAIFATLALYLFLGVRT
ncbi:MAG: LptF/LptG family permease, partial [Acidobacteria bacterium]|nr:LptF/LptG family permease [Acidobacteriota bacterium]